MTSLKHLAFLALSFASSTPAVADSGIETRIDMAVRPFLDLPITGMSVAVSREGEIIARRDYGIADIAANRPVQPNTSFEIGSITKQFTAAVVLRLAEAGKIDIDGHIDAYLPELKGAADGVTVRHLLSHLSGLYDGPVTDDLTKPIASEQVIATLREKGPVNAPGERFRYNNNGYYLLGLLIERVTGDGYGDHLKRVFFEPLGMDHMAICASPRGPNASAGYDHPARGPATPVPFAIHHPSVNFSAGAICGTSADLVRWQVALTGGHVVSPASYNQMTTPATLTNGQKTRYGMGMEIGERDGETVLYHGGASSGFITELAYRPADRLGIAILTNGIYSGDMVEQVESAVARAVRGDAPQTYPDLPTDATTRARFAGTYSLGPVTMDVYEQGAYLRAQPPGQVAARLLYQGQGRFLVQHDPEMSIRFQPDAAGVMEMIISKGGRDMPPGRRVGP
ncbi:serine hydrolase domain-containing protein [Allosphingosinicella vermicomposti]|uniref:serine hydrolase domain-containing protein n=1 Tax=Allosphingosinicella vermicomposti TaxID=614671 RepID=UPI000D1039F2|nr:serine hydrolase domain-containing protein [Allosphingosinicella vermicomposti]